MKIRTEDKWCRGMNMIALTVLVLLQILIWFLRVFYVNEQDCIFEYLFARMHDVDVAVSEDAKLQMAEYLARQDLPRYQIYTHNCDTVDRELMALVDSSVKRYNTYFEHLTPVGNYKTMCCLLGDEWGYKKIGEDSLKEKFLLFFGLSF